MLLVLPLKKLITRTERWLSGKEDLGLVPITHIAPHTSNSDPGYPTPLLTSSSIRHACSCMTFKRNIHKPKKIRHPISKFPQIQKGAQIIEAQLDAISQMLSFICSSPPPPEELWDLSHGDFQHSQAWHLEQGWWLLGCVFCFMELSTEPRFPCEVFVIIHDTFKYIACITNTNTNKKTNTNTIHKLNWTIFWDKGDPG